MNSAKKHGIRRRTERGAVLMVVLIAMVALLGLGMTGLFLTSGSIQMNTNINLRNQALMVAEAGVERARDVLNNTAWIPPMSILLKGSNGSLDEIVTDTNQCLGESRGAILVDSITPDCNVNPVPLNCILKDVGYPSVDRTADLPAEASTAIGTNMGRYTVYIRQDPADCRMSNFTCEIPPAPAPQSVTATSTDTNSGTDTLTALVTSTLTECLTEPAMSGLPHPNGSVVVRSEGVASDGKTRVVIEVTMSPSLGAAQARLNPMSALCAAGAAGCDDNASIQSGIVVNSNAPQTTPPVSNGGAGGNGGSPGTGGAVGGAAGTTTVPPGVGGSSSMGGALGTGGAGTGGLVGTGGAPLLCPEQTCAKIAIMGVPGVWDDKATASNSRDTLFFNYLKSHDNSCNTLGQITLPMASNALDNYTTLIIRDIFHTDAERLACMQTQNVTAYNWNGWGYDPIYNAFPCKSNNNQPEPRCYPKPGKGTQDNWKLCTACKANALQICTPHSGTNAGIVNANCTSYFAGSVTVSATEAQNIAKWAYGLSGSGKGGGIATTVGYYYDAVEAGNVNKILSYFGMKYSTDGSGRVYQRLGGIYDASHSGGVNVGQHGATTDWNYYTDFLPGAPPLNYDPAKKVTLLQVRTGDPVELSFTNPLGLSPAPVPVAFATLQSQECVMTSADYQGSNSSTLCKPYSDPNQCKPPASFSPPPAIIDPLPLNMGYYLEYGKARVVAWGDEWLTYDSVWETQSKCGTVTYQPDYYWNNVVRWMARCAVTGNGGT